ncbi:MAG TPA: phosphate ABC transporter permease PstA [Ktedonobacteraceae bacterium]|nr:phosphate ABC transporter permease PstA [Ktedonobacteraceae bacterium]
MNAQSAPSTAFSSEEAQLRWRRQVRLVSRLKRGNAVALSVLWLITVLVTVIFVAIVLNLVWTGLPALLNPSFYGTSDAGIAPELFNTFYILILTELFLFPISLGAAIYLVEYARQGLLTTAIHFAAETLAGVPSIVLGMFGFLVFSSDLHLSFSRLAGALTLLCLNFPIGLRLYEDALGTVPRELREGSLALGATKWRTIRTVVLPSALPGIVTGLILTAGKIIGEAAALLFTMGLFNPANVFTLDPTIASDTLTTRLYYLKGAGAGTTSLTSAQETLVAAGIAAILILLLLLINIAARSIGRVIQRRLTAA